MRPLFLTVEGVKSIAEKQTVNFEKLAQNGIFGIFGKTGSGKSSILDAIVLALYGEVIGKMDNDQFINSSCNQAMVELVFYAGGQGEKRKFRLKRSYKFDKNRVKLRQPEATLWEIKPEGEFAIAEGTKIVSQKIREEIIGLEKEEFLKCIALPQGEFSAFIKLTRSERLKVIGKLFDLQKYGKNLYDKVRSLDVALELEESKLNGELTAYAEVENLNFEELEKEFNNIKQKHALKSSENNKDREQLKVAQTVKNWCDEREQKQIELEKKYAYKSVIEGFKVEINKLDGALQLKDIISICENECGELKVKREELLTCENSLLTAKQNLESALKDYQTLPNLAKQKEELIAKRANVLSNQSLNAKVMEVQGEISKLLKEYGKSSQDVKFYQDKCAKNSEKVKKIDIELQKVNLSKLLENFGSEIEISGINSLVNEQINFLKQLSSTLENEVKNYRESAVYALIDGYIQKLKAILNDKKQCSNIKESLTALSNALDASTKLNADKQKFLAENQHSVDMIENLKKQLEQIKERGDKLRAEEVELKQKMLSLFGEAGYEGALKTVNQAIKELENSEEIIRRNHEKTTEAFSNANVKVEKLKGVISQLNLSYTENSEKLKKSLEQSGQKIEQVKEILQNEKTINANRITVQNYEKDVHALENALGEINGKLKDAPKEYFNMQFFAEKCDISSKELQDITEKMGEIKTKYEIGLKNKEKWCIIVDNLKTIKKQRELYSKLIELVKLDRFMEFVAEEYLGEIADIAGRRILELTNGRYGLVYKSQDNFYVTDNLKGGVLRPTASLSGGETFLVSLSLALALSFKISSRAMRPIDFFFLDEGFGTLDEELINTVTDSLEKLHRSRLTVGLITHVAELKNRIQSKLYVTGATATHGTVITESF